MDDHKRYYKEALLQGRQGGGVGGKGTGRPGLKVKSIPFSYLFRAVNYGTTTLLGTSVDY